MSTSVQLLINNVDYTQYLEQGTWTITQQYTRQGGTATFYLVDEHPYVGNSPTLNIYIPAMATVTFTDTGLNEVLFAGLATAPEVQFTGANRMYWSVQCTDYTYFADHGLITGDFVNFTVDQIALALVAQANCGIIAAEQSSGGFVVPGPVIPRIQFVYSTLSNALVSLIQVASTYTSWGWYVDETRNLHFAPLVSVVNTGVTFTDNIQLADSNTLGHYDTDNFSYTWDATQLRNRAVVRGSSFSTLQTDTWYGDGVTTQWAISQVPDTSRISSASLLIGGSATAVSIQSGTSATTPFVVVQNNIGAWFLVVNAAGGGSIPTLSTPIVLKYYYTAPIIAQVDNTASESTYSALPNHGVFATYILDINLKTLASAQQRGQAEVFSFGLPEERVAFWSTEPFTGHVRAGQIITWSSQVTPNSANSGSPGLTDTFLILQNTISASQHGYYYRVYQITAARTSLSVGI
jgi:hypothetical protein